MSIVAAVAHISYIAELLFAQLTLLPTHQNLMHYDAFQSVRHPKSALSVRASTPHVIHVPWTHHRLSIPNCILIGSAVFAQFTAKCLYTSQCELKRD